MIRYKIDVCAMLSNRGINTTIAKQTGIFSQSVMQKFKNGDTSITIDCLNRLCIVLNLQPSEILEYVPCDNELERRIRSVMEKRIYKVTLEDIRQLISYHSRHYGGTKYVMIEQNFLNDPDSSSEIYVDNQGGHSLCSAFPFGEITPSRTYLISYEVCGEYSNYVDFDEFCQYLYDYIQTEYKERYLT